ncbi:MAG: flagellar hook-basal body complex protein FliE [Firmicutes bacterium]|nr:flagellar hook-basal body complex protein FliE [Bacillota bacterium]
MSVRIQPLGLTPKNISDRKATPASATDFGQLLNGLLEQAIERQTVADELSAQLALGQTDDVAAVMIAVEKAALCWQLLQQVRNKLVEAWQEVMRIQV